MKKLIIFLLTIFFISFFVPQNINVKANGNELGGMHYIWWNFGNVNLKEINIQFTIYNDLLTKDGLYLQMYQGEINGVGFYFGLQTRVGKPNEGLAGKGIIFSRWETQDLSNSKVVENGWTEAGGYEDNFISIRKSYNWINHTYSCKIKYIESDNEGDWYGVWIKDLDNNNLDYLGSLRFPKVTNDMGIKNGGGTWTEIYYKEKDKSSLPDWHVSINEIYGVNFENKRYYPKSATLICSEKFQNINIIYDENTQKFHFYSGENIKKEIISKEINLQKLIVDYLPKPITAGAFPEITGEPLTIKVMDQNGDPIDLSLNGKYTDEYILENCFKEEDIKVGSGKWLRKSIKGSDILIDFSDKKEGIYRFYGFIANDKGQFKIGVEKLDDNIKGEVTMDVVLPQVKFEILNLDDEEKRTFAVDGSEENFKMTAGDLRSYKVSVEVKDAHGNVIGSCGPEKSVKSHNFYLSYASLFIPSTSFTPKYNNYLFIEDKFLYFFGDFSIYQNTTFDSGLFYKNGVPLYGGIYNFDYNYDQWNWGEMFADVNKNKKIDLKDTLVLNEEGRTSFIITPADVGFVSGLIGTSVFLYKDKPTGKLIMSFNSSVDIKGGENSNPDGIMQIDYFSHIDKKIEIEFINFELYKIEKEDNREKVTSLTKDAYNPDNYDLTYGIENRLLIKAFPADRRDLPINIGIGGLLVGNIEIWAYDKFNYNDKQETVLNLVFRPRSTGTNVAMLVIELVLNEDFEDCFAKINFFNQYETLFWLYDLSEPDFNLKNRSFDLLENPPKTLTTSKKSNWDLPIFDVAKGLEIIYEFDNPPTVFMETTLIVKVVERGPKFPALGVYISVYGSGIDLVSITDSDGFAKFKIEPTEIGEIIIVAKKKDYVIDRKEIEVKDKENILPSKPENVKVEISKEVGVKIEWSPSIPGTNPISGYEIWKGKSETSFILLDVVGSNVKSYIDNNVKFGESCFYIIRAFDTGLPKNYSKFSDVVSISIDDTTPPTLNILFPENNIYINKDILQIRGTVFDYLSGIDYLKINDENVIINENGEFEKEVTIIQGENKIKIEAIDRAGNKIEKILTVYLDNIPPEILVSLPNEVYDSMLSIDGKIKDDLSGIESLKINGVNVNISSNSSFTYSLSLYEGDNKIKFEAVDKAGNKTTKEITVKYIKRIVLKLQIGNKNMYVNDEQVDIDVSPTIIEGRTYLPIRWVAEPLSAEVEWDGNERKVTITLKGTTIELWIGKNMAKVNGVDTPIDPDNPKVVPIIISGRTMLPVRFVAENLGCKVDWEGVTKTITITYPAF